MGDIVHFRSRITASIKETVNATDLSPATLYRLIKAGKIKTTKVGSRTLVIVRSVADLLDPEAA